MAANTDPQLVHLYKGVPWTDELDIAASNFRGFLLNHYPKYKESCVLFVAERLLSSNIDEIRIVDAIWLVLLAERFNVIKPAPVNAQFQDFGKVLASSPEFADVFRRIPHADREACVIELSKQPFKERCKVVEACWKKIVSNFTALGTIRTLPDAKIISESEATKKYTFTFI